MNRQQRRNGGADVPLSAVVKVDGVEYPFDPGEVTGTVELELFRQSGMVLSSVIEDVQRAPASFHIAALVFLSRRARGDVVTFDEVADAIRVTSEFELVFPDGEDDGPGGPPEPPAAD